MISVLVLSLAAVIAMSSCESKEKVALAKAEQCINKSNSSNVAGCSNFLEGMDSEKANMMKCSIVYIEAGFTGDRLADAFQKVKSNTTPGTDPMVSALGFMAFSNQTLLDAADVVCNKSNVVSMKRLVTMSKMATNIATLGGILGGIPADGISDTNALLTAIQNLAAEVQDGTGDGVPTQAQLESLGSTVTQAAGDYCSPGSAYESTPICTNLNNSIAAGTTPDVIVNELLSQLQM
jgi:hypothetical protein